ncbi:MAG: hypothetical protein ACPGEG_03395 [Salibacteraceae bacterium]
MQANRIHSLFTDSNLLKSSVSEVDQFIKDYPQVSLFQTLKAKQLQLLSDPDYRKQLKKAAIFSPNRKVLYENLIQPKVVEQIEAVQANSASKEPEEIIDTKVQKAVVENVLVDSAESKTTEKPVAKLEDVDSEKERKLLEQEILNHAISSSILLESSETIEEAEEETPSEKVNETVVKTELPENYDSLGLLDWLKVDQPKTIEKTEPVADPTSLISNFIKKSPSRIEIDVDKHTYVNIERPKQEFFSPENMAKMSLMEDEDLVTETLAKIYADQGNFAKAKKAYKKLSLKFPEKSNYFARLIKELGNKH